MKKAENGNYYISDEDREKYGRLEKEFINRMREEALTFQECEYVLDGCKHLMGMLLLGEFFDQ